MPANQPLTRTNFRELIQAGGFLWLTGIEDTFVVDPHRQTGRGLDEYELTGHYDRWRDDLDLAASLDIQAIRYGIPWYRVQPQPAKWDWSFADAALGRLLELGIEPVVDLVHYGTPAWLENGFLNADYPKRVADYAAQVARRYAGRIHWYTPLNEPRVTAWYCGKLGWWPPYRRGDQGFLDVLTAVCEGIVRTDRALHEVDPEIVCCHVDATDLYTAVDPADQALADWKQAQVFLPLDLVQGRVDPTHLLWSWLVKHRVAESRLAWLADNAVVPDVVGLNLYPMFTNKVISRTPSGRRTRMVRGKPSLLRLLGRLYHDRYQLPLIVTETASDGDVATRAAWLDNTLEEANRLRCDGVPMVGYTWWPMFSLVAWAYRQRSDHRIDRYLVHMGLWDLDPNLDRVETPLVDRFRTHVRNAEAEVQRVS